MVRKMKYWPILLTLAIALTGCGKNTTDPELATLPSLDGNASQITGSPDRDEFLFEGDTIEQEPTYKNGTPYTAFGVETLYTVTKDGSNVTCSFLLPDTDVSVCFERDTFTALYLEDDMNLAYGYFDRQPSAQENHEKLMESVMHVLSAEDVIPVELQIQEETEYPTAVYSFQTIIAKAKTTMGSDVAETWVYIMGTPVNENTYIYWVVEDPASDYGQFLRDCENIMLSFEVIP